MPTNADVELTPGELALVTAHAKEQKRGTLELLLIRSENNAPSIQELAHFLGADETFGKEFTCEDRQLQLRITVQFTKAAATGRMMEFSVAGGFENAASTQPRKTPPLLNASIVNKAPIFRGIPVVLTSSRGKTVVTPIGGNLTAQTREWGISIVALLH